MLIIRYLYPPPAARCPTHILIHLRHQSLIFILIPECKNATRKRKVTPPLPRASSYIMKSGSQLAVSLLVATACGLHEGVSADPAPKQCYYYTAANTTAATCDEMPNYVCSGGCTSFVTAEGCQPTRLNAPQGAPTTQICNWGFGRDTARAKACITTEASYSCRGTTTGEATCYDCHSTQPN